MVLPAEFIAVSEHEPSYDDPIFVRKGDQLETFARDNAWPGWIWCRHPDGRSGWVPESILQASSTGALVLEDYSAIELRLKIGERVRLLKTESGWGWCRAASGEEGWVPLGALSSETT